MQRFAKPVAAFLVIVACLWFAEAVGENDARLLLDWRTGAIAGLIAVVALTPTLLAAWRARKR